MSDVQVAVEEMDEQADGTAKASFGVDGVFKVSVEGKEEVVTRAVKALFTELADVLFEGVTEEDARELLRQFEGASADLKDDSVYHARIKLKTDD